MYLALYILAFVDRSYPNRPLPAFHAEFASSLMEPDESPPAPPPSPPTPPLYFVSSDGGLLDLQKILHGEPTTESPRLSSPPFEDLQSEKITADLGPWLKHVGGPFSSSMIITLISLKLRSMGSPSPKHNYQVRVRSKKCGNIYTLRRFIVGIARFVKSTLDAASYKVSQYYTSCL